MKEHTHPHTLEKLFSSILEWNKNGFRATIDVQPDGKIFQVTVVPFIPQKNIPVFPEDDEEGDEVDHVAPFKIPLIKEKIQPKEQGGFAS